MSEEQWIEYAASSIKDFDGYETAYTEYLAQEHISSDIAPAISAKDLFGRPQIPITSYVPGFVYAGSLNLLAGEPKAGKSTLAWHICNAISNDRHFLGEEVRNTNVLYVTEQNEVSFRQETATIPKFSDNPNLYILMPETMPTTVSSWDGRVNFWGQKLDDTKSSILVIDTFGAYANLPPGGENDSACIAERLMQLKQLYKGRPNLGIILVHHIRKPSTDPRAGGVKEFADLRDARGSSAIVGSVDHCIMVSKAAGQQFVRNIHIEGRFETESKFSLVLTESGYTYQTATRNSFRRN